MAARNLEKNVGNTWGFLATLRSSEVVGWLCVILVYLDAPNMQAGSWWQPSLQVGAIGAIAFKSR